MGYNKEALIEILKRICVQVEVAQTSAVLDLQKYIEDNQTEKETILFEIEYFIRNLTNIVLQIYLFTVILYLEPKKEYIEKILEKTLNNNNLTKENKYYLLWQLVSKTFGNSALQSNFTAYYLKELYHEVYGIYSSEFGKMYSFIAKENRNKKLIFVMTGQMLSLNHAPTKTAIDRCYNLIKLGYEIVLINTTELVTQVGVIPFLNGAVANKNSDFLNYNHIEFQNEKIPFYQCEEMPTFEGIINIMMIVNEYKPYMILSLGSYNLTADLCSNIVPVASVATVFSSIPTSKSTLLITGKELTQEDYENIEKSGFTQDALISSRFTFTFKEQSEFFDKKSLNIDENKFIIALIGARLSKEITDDFIKKILFEIIAKNDVQILLIGGFDKFDSYSKTYPEFKNNFLNLGYQDDILAVLDLCDLVINPPRSGGGSSAAEALYKGIPVITLKSGDVFVNVGEDFSVDTLSDMINSVNRYINDKEYYLSQSKKAKERVKILMDSQNELEILLNKIYKNPLFK